VYWKPPELFEQSRDEDMIGVWKLEKYTITTLMATNAWEVQFD
jgi:hypothetical protein